MQRQFRSDDTPRKWTPKYGNAHDGNKTVTANPENLAAANAGLIGDYTADPDTAHPVIQIDDASTFEDGDLVLLHQTRDHSSTDVFDPGNAGVWELNKIRSGAGTLFLTLEFPLTKDFHNDSPTGAAPFDFTRHTQIYEMKEYKDVTINNGASLAPYAWSGNTGGILAFFVKGTLTINGAINNNSNGFRGGSRNDVSGNTGESIAGYYQHQQPFHNGGGGGEKDNGGSGGGAGGANGASGNNGGTSGPGQGGTGGTAVGNADGTVADLGGGGGMGGDGWAGGTNGPGGPGGGLTLIIAKKIIVNPSTGAITNSGGAGGNGDPSGAGQKAAPGGGGAGGYIILKGQIITLGTNRVTAPGGAGGANTNGDQGNGGNGSVGRIHVDYAKTLTGSTTPTMDTREDKNLFALRPAAALTALLKK